MRTTHLAAITLSLGLLALGTVAIGPDAKKTPTAPGAERPELIVARFHADWCGTCTQLAPKFDMLLRAAADQPVLFVTFDLTTVETRRQAALLAGALGLESVWDSNGMKTGQILIVCGRSREIVATVPAAEDSATSLATLRHAATTARSGGR